MNRQNYANLVQETLAPTGATTIAANNNIIGGEEDDLNVAENVVIENSTPRM